MKDNLKLVCPKCGTPHQPHSPHTLDADGFERCEIRTIATSNNCWCQGDVSDAFKDLMPDNATWATKEEFDKAPVVGYIIEGVGLVFTDRGGHEVNA